MSQVARLFIPSPTQVFLLSGNHGWNTIKVFKKKKLLPYMKYLQLHKFLTSAAKHPWKLFSHANRRRLQLSLTCVCMPWGDVIIIFSSFTYFYKRNSAWTRNVCCSMYLYSFQQIKFSPEELFPLFIFHHLYH